MGALQRETWRRHAAHYGERLAAIAADQWAGRDDQATAEFDALWPQIDLAHRRILSVDGLDDGELAYRYFALVDEGARRRRPTRDRGRGAGAALRYAKAKAPALHASILCTMGVQAQESSSLPRARALLRSAVRILRHAERASPGTAADPHRQACTQMLAMALRRLGDVEHDNGDHAAAESLVSQSLAIALRIRDDIEVALCLNDLAAIVAAMGRHADALRHYEQAAGVAMRLEQPAATERALGNMADVLCELGRLPEARRAVETALDLARRLGDQPEQARRLHSLAAIDLQDGDPGTALTHARSALEIAERLGDRQAEALASHLIGSIHRQAGREPEAVVAYEWAARVNEAAGRGHLSQQSQNQAEAVRARQRLTDTMDRIGAAQAESDQDRALDQLSTLADELRTAKDPILLSMCLFHLGKLRLERKEPEAALTAHTEALQGDNKSLLVVLHLRNKALALRAMGALVPAVLAEQQVVAHCARTAEHDPHLAFALARLGGLARQLCSYHAARKAYEQALGLFGAIDPDNARLVTEELATMSSEYKEYLESIGLDPQRTWPYHEAGLRRILTRVAQADDAQLTITFNDGRTTHGSPATIAHGVIPLLTLTTAEGQLLVPLERVVTVVLVDWTGHRTEMTPQAAPPPEPEPSAPAVSSDRAEQLYETGTSHAEKGRYEQAILAFDEAVALCRTVGTQQRNLATTLVALGMALTRMGRWERALVAVRESLSTFGSLVAADPPSHLPEQAEAFLLLGVCLWELGRHEESLSATEEAIGILRRVPDEQPGRNPQLARALDNHAAILARTGRPAEATPLATEAVDLLRAVVTTDPRYTDALCHALDDLAVSLAGTGDWPPALTAIEESVTARRALHRADPVTHGPPLAESLDLCASILGSAGRCQEATTPAEEAVRLYRGLTFANQMYDPRLAGALANLGTVYAALGRTEESVVTFEQSLRLLRPAAHQDPAAHGAGLAQLLGNVGSTYADGRRWPEALAALEEAEQMSQGLATAGLLPPPTVAGVRVFLTTATAVLTSPAADGTTLTRVGRLHAGLRERLASRPVTGHEKELGMFLHHLSAKLGMAGMDEDAVAAGQEGIVLQRNLARTDEFSRLVLAGSLTNLSASLTKLGRWAEAEEAAAESVEIYEEMSSKWPADHPGPANAVANLNVIRFLLATPRTQDDGGSAGNG
jgi:tetratricopeptide (TPR) repeat protein